jgi:Domain of unknown function (DUF4190)
MDPNEISKPRTSVAAISSMVCGILGCIPFVTSLAAVILGIIGIKKTGNPRITGRGMAIAGLILGVLGLVGWATAVSSLYLVFKAGEPARVTAEQFTRDLSAGKIDEALALSAEGTDRVTLVALSEQMKPWGAFKSLMLTSVDIKIVNEKSVYTIGGVASFPTEVKVCNVTLNKEGESFKIVKFDFK